MINLHGRYTYERRDPSWIYTCVWVGVQGALLTCEHEIDFFEASELGYFHEHKEAFIKGKYYKHRVSGAVSECVYTVTQQAVLRLVSSNQLYITTQPLCKNYTEVPAPSNN